VSIALSGVPMMLLVLPFLAAVTRRGGAGDLVRRARRRFACDGVDYVLTSSFQADREPTTGCGGEPTGYKRLGDEGKRVATFDPGTTGARGAIPRRRHCPRTGHAWLGIVSRDERPAMVTKAYLRSYTYAVY
jgi:hypothetical protein